MKTEGIFYVAPNKVELREFEIGDPDLYQVQLELKATAICAWDQALYKGILPAGTTYPFLHGHEGVGIIRKVGARVKGYKEGDLVTTMGDNAALWGHYANVGPAAISLLKPDVTDYEHWQAEPVSCVMNGVDWCRVQSGDRIAIIGTGFMGLLLVQGLVQTPAAEVIAIEPNPDRLALAAQFGATQTINPLTEKGKAAMQALAERPVDIVVETAGTQVAFDQHYAILRKQGKLCIFAWHKDGKRMVDLGAWHMSGYEVGNASPSISPNFARIFARAVSLMEKGVYDLKPLVTHVSSPEDAPKLFEIAAHQSDGYIKGVVRW
ncbi:MAG: zinc-dependent alcohol dehydrogenase [Anaerolineae bacterium]|jgi:threonine dehydrogenase-like Zn-dependent dehydrogenase|nr:zinc-binding dehydrogenase [Chloroflexota bacterium]